MLRRAITVLIAMLAVLVFSGPARAQTKLVNSPSIFEPVFASDPAGAIQTARQKIAAGDLARRDRVARDVCGFPSERDLADALFGRPVLSRREVFEGRIYLPNNDREESPR